MTPEDQKPSEIYNILSATAIIGGIYLLSNLAFSKGTRNKIWARDKGVCQMCGQPGHCECGHVSHDKSLPEYDNESNGRLVDLSCHYTDHYNRHGTEGLGLNTAQNKWSLNTIWSRLTESQKKKLPPPNTVE